MKINESQLKKIIKESIVKILKENIEPQTDEDFNRRVKEWEDYYRDQFKDCLYYDKENAWVVDETMEGNLIIMDDDDSGCHVIYDREKGLWTDDILEDIYDPRTDDFPKLDRQGAIIVAKWISKVTPGSEFANPSLYME